MQRRIPWFNSFIRKIPWRMDNLLTPVFLGFPGGSDDKEFIYNVGDLSLIPWLGRSPGGEYGNPLQYSCLENPHGQRSLAGYSPWGCKESDMAERLSTAQHSINIHNGILLSQKERKKFCHLQRNGWAWKAL